MFPLTIALPDLDATAALAARLAPLLRTGDALLLHGDLGVGKTAFARALVRALGITGDVPSPTFTLVQSYLTPHLTISHFDLYRLKSADELEELGWDDARADGVVLVEWPERAADFMPPDALTLTFALDADQQRSCVITAPPAWQARLVGFG
jgi:tRNA threonylcarbamoyladenosine biosynthesis protein TsaE